jgi:hypothetical protein
MSTFVGDSRYARASATHRSPLRSNDRFQELLEDLADADEPNSPKAAIRQFIFTSANELETIQNNFRINNLPAEWNTQDWPTLLTLCRDYNNSVKLHHQVSRRSLP